MRRKPGFGLESSSLITAWQSECGVLIMNLFNKLPGFQKSPAGLERKILRWIPRVFLVGTGLIALPSMLTRLWHISEQHWVASKLITTVDIYAFGLLTAFWTALFTVGLGALTVMIMKGPAYVADAYCLPDADRPRAMPPDQEGQSHRHHPYEDNV